MAIKDLNEIRKHFFLCNGGSCKLLGAEQTTQQIRSVLKEMGLGDAVHTTKTLCNGRCKDGPIVISIPDGIWFKQIDATCVQSFLEKYLLFNCPPENKILFRYGAH